MERNIINFIQKYYSIEINGNKQIFLRDIFEDDSDTYPIKISDNVQFIWGRAKKVTGMDLLNKEFIHIQKIIREVFRSKQSIDFYEFMLCEIGEIEQKDKHKGLIIPLKDIKHEFPNLYGDNVNEIISENKKKNELP